MALIPMETKNKLINIFRNTDPEKIHTWDDVYLLIYDIAQFIQAHNNIPVEKKELN